MMCAGMIITIMCAGKTMIICAVVVTTICAGMVIILICGRYNDKNMCRCDNNNMMRMRTM